MTDIFIIFFSTIIVEFLCVFFACRVEWYNCSASTGNNLAVLAMCSGLLSFLSIMFFIVSASAKEGKIINKYENNEIIYNKVEKITIVNEADTVRTITFEKAK